MVRRLRVTLFLMAAVASLWVGVVVPLSGARERARQAADPATARANVATEASLASFARARQALAREPVIGYLTGAPITLEPFNGYIEPYFWAQYALAPTVVDAQKPTFADPTLDRPIVLVNYLPAEVAQLDRLLKTPGVRLIVRLGPGRALIRMPEH